MLLKSLAKKAVYSLSYFLRYQNLLLHRIKKHNFVPILSLHRVSSDNAICWPPLTPKIFDELLRYLKKQFAIVPLHELNDSVGKKPQLVLSFDDGYYDFIDYAMPILKKHGVKANQNIIPSQLLGEKPLWNIALYDFLNAAPSSLIKEMNFSSIGIAIHPKSRLNKATLSLQLSHQLKQLSSAAREIILQDLELNWFSKLTSYPQTRMIRLHEMSDVIAEHEVGVHSYSHTSMANETMDYFCADFKKCRDFFTAHRFPRMDIYAFPNGSYKPQHISYLQQQGVTFILRVDNAYTKIHSSYSRFHIAASSYHEAVLQSLGIKSRVIAS